MADGEQQAGANPDAAWRAQIQEQLNSLVRSFERTQQEQRTRQAAMREIQAAGDGETAADPIGETNRREAEWASRLARMEERARLAEEAAARLEERMAFERRRADLATAGMGAADPGADAADLGANATPEASPPLFRFRDPAPAPEPEQHDTPFRFRSTFGTDGSPAVAHTAALGTPPAPEGTAADRDTHDPNLTAPRTALEAQQQQEAARETALREANAREALIIDILRPNRTPATPEPTDHMQIDPPGPSAAPPAAARASGSTSTLRAAIDIGRQLEHSMGKGVPPLASSVSHQPSTQEVVTWTNAVTNSTQEILLLAPDTPELGLVAAVINMYTAGELREALVNVSRTAKSEVKTIEQLISWVRKYFGVTGDSVRDDAMQQLQQGRVKQRENETVIAFHSRFAHILRSAGEGVVSDAYALRQFYYGLLPSLRTACATDALGKPWSEITSLVAYANGKQLAARAAEAEARRQGGNRWGNRGGRGGKNMHGTLHAHARSHGGNLHGGNSQAQVNMQVGQRVDSDRKAANKGQWQTVTHQRNNSGAGTANRGPPASTSGAGGSGTGSFDRPVWQDVFCRRFGLCKKCLVKPVMKGNPARTWDGVHTIEASKQWHCAHGAVVAWPPPGYPEARIQSVAARMVEERNAQQPKQ